LPPLPPSRARRYESDTVDNLALPRARPRFWLPLAACIVLSLAAAAIYVLWNMARAPRWADLRLDAAPAAGHIELTWDRNAPALARASRGVLTVDDGSGRKDIELSAAELRAGKLEYPTASQAVLFRMALYGGGIAPLSDSLRVVAAQPAPSPPPQVAEAKGEAARSVQPPAPAVEPARTATPVSQPQPRIPDGIRARIRDRVVVPVTVRVNERGTVVSATAPETGDSVQRYLADAAVKAARRWRFTPARTASGRPAASTRTIEFAFTSASVAAESAAPKPAGRHSATRRKRRRR
jgi:hypothetical protein